MQPDVSNIPLRDIHLPDPVSWWPPALGWWLLLALIAFGVALVIWQKQRRRLYRLRHAAMAELDAIYQNYQQQYDAKRYARDLSALLRRTYISYFPNNPAAGLAGKAWLEFLDSLLSSKHNKSGQKFADGVGQVLVSAPYQSQLKNSDIDADAMYELCREWIFSLGPLRHGKPSSPVVKKEAAHVSV
ncbi:DUF4381 domain-containing protein [Kaarinaea lacus]